MAKVSKSPYRCGNCACRMKAPGLCLQCTTRQEWLSRLLKLADEVNYAGSFPLAAEVSGEWCGMRNIVRSMDRRWVPAGVLPTEEQLLRWAAMFHELSLTLFELREVPSGWQVERRLQFIENDGRGSYERRYAYGRSDGSSPGFDFKDGGEVPSLREAVAATKLGALRDLRAMWQSSQGYAEGAVLELALRQQLHGGDLATAELPPFTDPTRARVLEALRTGGAIVDDLEVRASRGSWSIGLTDGPPAEQLASRAAYLRRAAAWLAAHPEPAAPGAAC